MRGVVMLLACAFLLAGCSGEETSTDDVTTSSTATTTADSTTTAATTTSKTTTTGSGGGNVGGEGGTASLTADVKTGNAPLTVTFTVDGDGDTVSWSLDFGDGSDAASGEDFPASVGHDYGEGAFTATATVTFADDSTADATVSIEAFAEDAPEPFVETIDVIEGCELCVDGDDITGAMGMGAQWCVGFNVGENGLDCAWVEIPEGYAGMPFSVFSELSGNFPLSSTGSPDGEFRTSCASDSEVVEQHIDLNHDVDFFAGVIPEGAGCLVAFDWHWPNLGHTFTISIGEDIHS